MEELRWKQRFEHFVKAFAQLEMANTLYQTRTLSTLESQGVIQVFEVTQELSWKVLKDFLEFQGYDEIYGSKNAIRIAFNVGLLQNAEVWMDMIKSRNVMSHTYDEQEMLRIVELIFSEYTTEFEALKIKMENV
mgnify:CR=1 FL=1|jgi:nucleotidyltransferase substrate binding protein (TIGR01987 family)